MFLLITFFILLILFIYEFFCCDVLSLSHVIIINSQASYSIRSMPRHLSHDRLAHSSSKTPYDCKSFIVRPCHPAMEESVRLSQAEYKTLQRFYHCSAQSNVRTMSVLHLREVISMQQRHLCPFSGVSGWSVQDSRH